jgi:hypothetical protein
MNREDFESFLKPLTDIQNGEYPVFNVTENNYLHTLLL